MKSDGDYPPIIERFVKPLAPILAVYLILEFLPRRAPIWMDLSAYLASAIILWIGWPWVRRNNVAKILGGILAAIVILYLGVVALTLGIGIGFVLLPVFFLAAPFLIYDLFFHLPGTKSSDTDSAPL
jgi:hypothetical protein